MILYIQQISIEGRAKMQILIEIPEELYRAYKDRPPMLGDVGMDMIAQAIANGTPLDEEETKLKRWIEKDIKMLNEIIESGWLISDLEKCPAIDACEDAITALKQYPVLDKVRAEIEQLTSRYSISKERGGMGQVEWSDRLIKESDVLQVIDKYRGNVDAI
jgi:hypothetical protein